MIYTVLSLLFYLLELTIFIECIASWIPQIQNNRFIESVHNFIYPLLDPFRRLQERLIPGLSVDFSPVVVLLIINWIREFIF